ncbi:putative ubiquitin-conjugating enzyme E2 [Tupanvirus soda lake]|uniref:E2 ubiquitin-conjugating enzyme n=2 Tax=Tupanvirus TaxID=2094720 RepID=A0A6N1NXB9_9VIRU|nr:putative ubiquitin-conjugating enzyme E2 [Tupanvirus soda lake]QKU35906.1 putative ubiquitin-conjugating enzyme E2 [Tupanvirus soda lake]
MSTVVNKRVIKDIRDGIVNLKNDHNILIAPEENDFYKIHFVIPGPDDTPFEGGLYHGMIRLNENHPYGPPNIHMITPSGRFRPEPYPIPNGSRGICTTTSSFHPETWTPMNNIETVIKGFLSLMCDLSDLGVGALETINPNEIKKLAVKSLDHLKSDVAIKMLFPDLHETLVNGTYKPVKLSDLSKNTSSKNTPKQKKSTNKKIIEEEFEEDEPEPTKSKRKPSTNKKIMSESESDSENNDSDDEIIKVSDSEDEDEVKPKKIKKTTRNCKKTKQVESESENEESEEEKPKRKSVQSKKKQYKPHLDEESENEESEEEEKPKRKPTQTKRKNPKNESENDDSEEEHQKNKKKPTKKTVNNKKTTQVKKSNRGK